MKNLKNIIIATAVLTATTAGFVLAEPWTNPTTTAPGANADSPINTSASNQTKQGGLSLGSLLVNNNASVLGNLGIGTNPQVKLHVKGNAKAFVLEGNGHVYMEYHPKGYAVGRKAYVGFGTPSKNDFYINNEYSSGVDLTLAENGNIGIGTVTPSQKLDVKGHIEVDGGYISLIKPVTAGTWARGLLFRSTETGAYESGIGYYGTATNLQRMFLGFGGNPWTSTKGMYILPNGNIGIGTVTPSRKLDVNGEIMTRTGTLYLRNNTQYLHGDNNSALHYRSNHSSYSQMLFRDKEVYGRVYGADNGQHFGLLDADGNWSYRATKDNHTAFVINNSEKMRILANGNVGIGTTWNNSSKTKT
ncbi:hypothetical protein CSB11_00525 [Candidatus Campbellbacteria bacterium]|nr:MAG: hypothetical protein CSB11_00525 [Candidatus Campbellbacteria bacterium]